MKTMAFVFQQGFYHMCVHSVCMKKMQNNPPKQMLPHVIRPPTSRTVTGLTENKVSCVLPDGLSDILRSFQENNWNSSDNHPQFVPFYEQYCNTSSLLMPSWVQCQAPFTLTISGMLHRDKITSTQVYSRFFMTFS